MSLTEGYAKLSKQISYIDKKLFDEYNIKQGLRNSNGTGVVIGITKVADVYGYDLIDGKKIPVEGRLLYRNHEITELYEKFKGSYMFEKATYLLLFGQIPTEPQLDEFLDLIYEYRQHDLDLFNSESRRHSLMNALQVGVDQLYFEDDDADLIDTENIIIHSLKIISRMPEILLKGYLGKSYNLERAKELKKQRISTAQFLLEMLNREFTDEDVKILDLALLVHAEHGGGNNSTFTVRLVSSAYTDTYSAIVAGISSLKGLRHGGANIKVCQMMHNIEYSIDYTNRDELKKYLKKIYDKKVFDKTGLIYGMGHAIYTKSDPRAELLKKLAKDLAVRKNATEKFEMHNNIEELTKEIFSEIKGNECAMCANVDMYSGLIYELLDLKYPIFTPLFTLARTSGWCAHRLEQIISDKKILRPAYKTYVE
ncbi:MAG: citrate synthase [Lachnospirales bacterium]